MNSEKTRPTVKIQYEKPTAVDLGAAAPVVGGSCVEGLEFGLGACTDVGNADTGTCALVGNSAGQDCASGDGATGGLCAIGGGLED